jgi:hypothetical protein
MQRLPAREGALGAGLLGAPSARPSRSDQVGILAIPAVTTESPTSAVRPAPRRYTRPAWIGRLTDALPHTRRRRPHPGPSPNGDADIGLPSSGIPRLRRVGGVIRRQRGRRRLRARGERQHGHRAVRRRGAPDVADVRFGQRTGHARARPVVMSLSRPHQAAPHRRTGGRYNASGAAVGPMPRSC